MQKRTRNVLLGASASGAFALSLPAGRLLMQCARHSCTTATLTAQLPPILLAVAVALWVFFLGSRLGRIRSGWLAALLLSSSLAWQEALSPATSVLILTSMASFGGGILLLRQRAIRPAVDSSRNLLQPILVLSLLWVVLVSGFVGFSAPAPRTTSATSMIGLLSFLSAGLLPWSLLVIPVGLWLREQRPWPKTTQGLLLGSALGLIFLPLVRVTTDPVWLPVLPALSLLGGLILGPGPEGLWPRRLVRLNLELIATFGIFLAFLVLSLLVSPSERLVPEGWVEPWSGTLAVIRAYGGVSMSCALVGLGLAALVIAQARGAHWLRASFPLALLLLLLRTLLG
jgi:hypothetical protein